MKRTSLVMSINLSECIAAFWFDKGMSVFLTHCKTEEIRLGLAACRAGPMTPTTCNLGKTL